ncbi:conserved hypothetical protein [Trichinella spiralis]|uniref:hypothetical protein n=1 Tax=Trichinella spiralis TaxID=6334 RepID=UPI0001EFF02D|nr:conserved hypothetical protein [Trichinella spiralis]
MCGAGEELRNRKPEPKSKPEPPVPNQRSETAALKQRFRPVKKVTAAALVAPSNDLRTLRHGNVIAKIAPNSMQIFALSQFPGYLPPAKTTANVSVHNAEGILVVCRQEFRITITTSVLPLEAVATVASDKVSSQCLVRKLVIWSYGRIRFLASQWADHRLGNWESCPYSHRFFGELRGRAVLH